MKKLIAIAVVFALVMGGVFAETSVSGGANGKLVLGQGKTGEDSTVESGGGMSLKLSGQNEEGTFGGEFVINANTRAASSLANKDAKAKIWWKPINMLKIQKCTRNFKPRWLTTFQTSARFRQLTDRIPMSMNKPAK